MSACTQKDRDTERERQKNRHSPKDRGKDRESLPPQYCHGNTRYINKRNNFCDRREWRV